MFIILKRKNIVFMLVIMLAVCMFSFGFTNENVVLTMNNTTTRKVPVYRVETDNKKVALTFDAAWGADKTTGILEILKKHNVKGTFFLVGFWIDEYPDLVKSIYEQGCDIGNHSLNHIDMLKLSNDEIKTEIVDVNKKIKEITNADTKVFRFPYGSYNTNTVRIVEELGIVPVQWSVDSLDWKGLGAAEILQRVETSISDGGIVLFHNNSENIIEALPKVIASLQNKGYELVGITDLVYTDNYTIDNNGVQHQKII